VRVPEQPRNALGEYQNAQYHPSDDWQDHAEIKLPDAARHRLVKTQVDQEIGGAHARHHKAQAHQDAAQQPCPDARCQGHVLHALDPVHVIKRTECHPGQQQPVPVLPPLFTRGFYQRREGPRDEADEQPGELGRVVGEGVVHHRRERHHPDDPADSDWQEIKEVLHKFITNVPQEADQRFVDAEHHRQHAARKPRYDRADAHQRALQHAHDPVREGAELRFFCLFCFHDSLSSLPAHAILFPLDERCFENGMGDGQSPF